MLIDMNNRQGERLTRLRIDLTDPPPVVHIQKEGRAVEEHYLDWDGAFDDESHLRKCVACNCTDLYVQRIYPAITGFIVVLIVAVLGALFHQLAKAPIEVVVGALIAVVVVNGLITFFSPKCLVCYRCGSRFLGTHVSRNRKGWDAATAKHHDGENPSTPPQS